MEKFAKNYGIFICVLLVLATLFCLIFGAVFFGEAAKIKNSELPENTGDSIGTAVTSLKCDKKRISKKNAPRQPAPVAVAGVSTSDNDDGEDYEEEEFIEADDIYFTDDVDDDDYEN
ncbi:MAG: hypothetical protein ACI4MW_03125 [Christensenellales bacterium]